MIGERECMKKASIFRVFVSSSSVLYVARGRSAITQQLRTKTKKNSSTLSQLSCVTNKEIRREIFSLIQWHFFLVLFPYPKSTSCDWIKNNWRNSTEKRKNISTVCVPWNSCAKSKKLQFYNVSSVSSIAPSSIAFAATSANYTKSVESKTNYVNSSINNNSGGYKNNNQNIHSGASHQETFANFLSTKQPQQQQLNLSRYPPSTMPKNEPVKLVYPSNNNNNNNINSTTIVTMNNNNNRVTFSTAPVNGSITLSPMTGQQQGQQMQGNIKIAQQQNQQTGASTLIFKNSVSQGGTTYVTNSPVTMAKTNNQVRWLFGAKLLDILLILIAILGLNIGCSAE